MIQQNERNKNEMGEYVVFLVESGYGVDTSKVMKEYVAKGKREKNASTG